jgi:peptide/nickel transport system substrate-binding protein
MMRNTNKSAAVAAVLLAAAMTASACSSSKSGGSPSGGATSKSIPKASVNDINRKDPKTLKGGTLTLAVSQYSTQWDLDQVDGSEANTDTVIRTLLPSLFHFDAGATASVNKDYLASAVVTATSPKQVVTYKLNPKAKWSDGKPLSVDDFKSTWNALNGKNTTFNAVSTTGYEQISDVSAGPDAQTIVVTFDKPFSDWQSLFSPLYPAAAKATPDALDNFYKGKIPITAGPFGSPKLDDATKTITVTADPTWWGDKPVLDKIIFRDMEVAAQGDAYNNHEIDAFDIGPSAALFDKVKGTQNSTIHYAGGPNFRHLTINTQSKVLGDIAVRKALFEATDRTQIAQLDLKNLGTWEPKTLDNHFFVNNQEGYQDNASSVAKFDPAQAKKDLDAAGWVVGSDGIRAKDGVKLSIKWVEPQGVKNTSNEAAMLTTMYKAIGVELKETPVSSDDYFDKYITPGNFDMTAYSYIGTPFPISSSISLYQSVTDQTKTHGNSRRDGTPAIDAMLATAAQDTDPAKAIADTNAADKAIWAEFGLFTLYQRPNIMATKSTLANYGAFGFEDVDWTKIGYTS